MAGYPEAHPDRIVSDPEEMKKNYWADVHYLKQKVCRRVHSHVTAALQKSLLVFLCVGAMWRAVVPSLTTQTQFSEALCACR